MDIRPLGIADSQVVFDFVQKLLITLAVRPADGTLGDVDKILADWKLDADRFFVFAAVDAGVIIGILTLVENFAIYAGGRYGVINELIIEADHRSKGAGKMLIEAALAKGRERGWRRIDVVAPPGDTWERTVKFYRREGFVFAGPKLKFML